MPFFLFLFVGTFNGGWAVGETTDPGALRRSIIALADIQARYVEAKQETTDPNQRLEEQRFADFLQYRIEVYCRGLLASGGPDALAQLPCPPATNLAPLTGQSRVQTSEEALSQLDASLLKALGDFDEMLLHEEERINAKQGQTSGIAKGSGSANTNGMAGTTGGKHQTGDQPGSGDGKSTPGESTATTTTTTTTKTSTKTSTTTQTQTKGKTSSSQPTGSGSKPSSDSTTQGSGKKGEEESTANGSQRVDTIDNRDDDIVARQLREAAEKETNPELQRKLWEEYRKYKGIDAQ